MHNKEYCRNCELTVPKITLLTSGRGMGFGEKKGATVYKSIPKTGYITKK